MVIPGRVIGRLFAHAGVIYVDPEAWCLLTELSRVGRVCVYVVSYEIVKLRGNIVCIVFNSILQVTIAWSRFGKNIYIE